MTTLKRLWSSDDEAARALPANEQVAAIAAHALESIATGGRPVLTCYRTCHPGKCSGFGLLFLPSTVSLEVDFGDYHLEHADTARYAEAMAIAASVVMGFDDDEGDTSEMLRKLSDHHGQASQDALRALVQAWASDTSETPDHAHDQ